MLKWAGCFEENQSLSLLGLLFESLVESVVIAGATTIQLAEEGRRGTCTTKYDILRPVQAKVLRRWFGVGQSAPTKALLAEVGWTSMEWKLKVAKIRLWERVKAQGAGRDSNRIAQERMRQVRLGEVKGLTPEARLIFKEMGREREWDNLEGLGTPWRKKALREWGRQADLDGWDTWRKSQGTLYQLTKKTHGRSWGTRKHRTEIPLQTRTGQSPGKPARRRGSHLQNV